MKVTDKLTLKSGKELSYRIVQAPMVTQGANLDGQYRKRIWTIMAHGPK